jgi:hypothetical protein
MSERTMIATGRYAPPPPLVEKQSAVGKAVDAVLLSPITESILVNPVTRFFQGIGDGIIDVGKTTWKFASNDAWEKKTWVEMGKSTVAVGLMAPEGYGIHVTELIDNHFDTRFGERQQAIKGAVGKFVVDDIINGDAQSRGKATGQIIGNILLAKGAGAVASTAINEVNIARRIGSIGGYGQYTYLRAGVKVMDVSTPHGKALFWSGIDGGGNAATQYALRNNLINLERTRGGNWLQNQNLSSLPREFQGLLWDGISFRFASGASGNIFVLQGNSIRMQSVWMRVERKILMDKFSNKKIQTIEFIDQATNQKSFILHAME